MKMNNNTVNEIKVKLQILSKICQLIVSVKKGLCIVCKYVSLICYEELDKIFQKCVLD